MDKKIQPIDEVMWAVKYQNGNVDTYSICKSKKYCIKRFLNESSKPWKWWYRKHSVRCIKVRVQITPIDNDLNDKK